MPTPPPPPPPPPPPQGAKGYVQVLGIVIQVGAQVRAHAAEEAWERD